ncbi:MAG: hypothetical protein HC860_13310 [Alkalinema sp. RU_4_3]|nr:hypothetical protein [Alkalinema sp. RU_4_3]
MEAIAQIMGQAIAHFGDLRRSHLNPLPRRSPTSQSIALSLLSQGIALEAIAQATGGAIAKIQRFQR